MAKFSVQAEMYLTIGDKPNTTEQQRLAAMELEQRINQMYWYDADGNLCSPRIHVKSLGGVVESDGKG